MHEEASELKQHDFDVVEARDHVLERLCRGLAQPK